jgi:autotransporter-associated beta strand protein
VGTVGPDIVTLTGNDAYPGGVFVGTGTLQIGDGGTTGGPSTVSEAEITNNGVLVFDRSDNIEVSGAVSDGASAGNGQGSIVQQGTGTLTLAGATTNIAGTITVSNGTLVISGLVGPGTNAVGGNLSVNGGTLQWGGASDVNILNVQGNMVISSGSIVVNLNKSLSVSNSFILMTNYVNLSAGTITASGGTLKLVNVGPALAAGDRFTLFSQPLPAQSASALTITGAGATWRNDLAVNGSITALSVTSLVNTHPPVVQVSLSGNNLNLGWPTNQGWTLQTNSVGLNASNQWFSYPGSTTLTNVIIPVLPGAPNVFFRMVYTNTP